MSDASMGTWMEYMHMQKTILGNETGVEVMLTAIDPNGNSQDIGTATSTMSGVFTKSFTPTMAGTYQIIATFAGSKSYGSSYSETAIVAYTPAAAPTGQPSQTIAPTES